MRLLAAAFLLVSLATARPDSGHAAMEGGSGDMDMGMDMSHKDTMSKPEDQWELSYWAYGQHMGSITAHVILEVLAWCFVLPVG